MHILFLTQIIPYPPDAGPKVKTWHVLRYLSGLDHKITLVSFLRSEEEQFVPALRAICESVHTVPIRRSRVSDVGYWLRSHLSGLPFLVERDNISEMRLLIQQLVQTEAVDLIHADQLTMAQFALPFRAGATERFGSRERPRIIFDAHNAVWTIVERMRTNSPWFLRPVVALEAGRIKRYEGEIVEAFDHTFAVTEADSKALEKAALSTSSNGVPRNPARITVVPIAVDVRELQPAARRPGSMNILTLGTLHYPPNADGIRWFSRQVFPLVRKEMPEATLTIVGKNPPRDFFEFEAENPQAIKITGYVPDLTPYMESAAILAVPVRAGGGMRVRILEAFARAVPVVTTTVGLEGIHAEAGRDVFVADTAEEFARAVVRLMRNPDLQDTLAAHGRWLAETQFDWQIVLKKMDKVYREIGPNGLNEQALEVDRQNST